MAFETLTSFLKHPGQTGISNETKTNMPTEILDQSPQTANDKRERRIKLAQLSKPSN